MKTWQIILIVLLFFIFLGYLIVVNISDSIDFDFEIKGVNVSGGVAGISTSLILEIKLTNNSKFNLRLYNVHFEMYYNNKLVVKTKTPIRDVNLKKGEIFKTDAVLIAIPDANTAEFVNNVMKKKKTDIQYYIEFKILGVTIKHKGNNTLN